MMIFHSVSFIDDHVLPPKLRKHRFVLNDVFIGGEKYIQLGCPHLALNDPSYLWRPFVDHNLNNKTFGSKEKVVHASQ